MKNLLIGLSTIFLLSQISFAKENKLSKIINTNTLKVCIWPQYYGISYLDPRTQKLRGIDSDLAVELAKDLNVNLQFVESSFPTLIDDITSDKCDIAMFAIGNTAKRAEKMKFTSPHLKSDIYAITNRNNNKIKSWNDIDKKGVIVSVAKGTYHEPIMKEKLKNATLIIENSFKQRDDEVKSGRADVFMTDYPYSKKMLAKTDWARLVSPEEAYHLTPYAWTIAYGNDKFYQRVERFIKDIKKDRRLINIAKKNNIEPIINLD